MGTRDEKRLVPVPRSIIKGLVNSLPGGGSGALASFTPNVMVRGRLLGHIQKLQEADQFIFESDVDVASLSPRLLREACNDRMIGGPESTITELQNSLADWLKLV